MDTMKTHVPLGDAIQLVAVGVMLSGVAVIAIGTILYLLGWP